MRLQMFKPGPKVHSLFLLPVDPGVGLSAASPPLPCAAMLPTVTMMDSTSEWKPAPVKCFLF